MAKWTSEQIPDLSGKVATITGGNAGLVFEISNQLASKNATVVIACRTLLKGEKAINRMKN